MGELYEVPLRASGKRDITIKAVAVEAIHNGPPARCPENIATRFLQSRNAKSESLSQAGGATDICLGMDYPFLQPRYLEKEFTGGQLHLYTSVFGAGLILRGVELPAVREPAYVTPLAVEAMEDAVELPEDAEDAVELPENAEDAVELPEDVEDAVELLEDVEDLVDLPEDEEALVDLPEDKEALVDLPEDKEALVDLHEDEEALVDLPEDKEALVDLPKDEEALEDPPWTRRAWRRPRWTARRRG
jgi:hypothetical protein